MGVKVSVLGLDGLPLKLLKQAIKDSMPYMASSASKFSFKEIKCIPPITTSSWASIMSGVNPGKHGVYHFFRPTIKDGVLDMGFYNALDLQHPRIHEMAALSGVKIKSLIVNPVPLKPIIPIKNSTIITLREMFGNPKSESYPPNSIEKLFFSYEEDPILEEFRREYKKRTTCNIIDLMSELIDKYIEAAEIIYELESYDLVWINIYAPDPILHKCGKALENPQLLSEFFYKIDKLIKIMDSNSENFILVSDHGFALFNSLISVSDILLKEGFLKTSSECRERVKIASRDVLRVPSLLYKLIIKLGLRNAARRFLSLYEHIRGRKISVIAGPCINYPGSRAYAPPGDVTYYIYINDKAVEEELLSILRNKYNIKAYSKYEIFNGPALNEAPDIILVADDTKYSFVTNVIIGDIFIDNKVVHHHVYGTFSVRLSENYEHLTQLIPPTPNNTIVAPLIQCILRIPISMEADDIELLRNICKEELKILDYHTKWRLYKKLITRRRVITSSK